MGCFGGLRGRLAVVGKGVTFLGWAADLGGLGAMVTLVAAGGEEFAAGLPVGADEILGDFGGHARKNGVSAPLFSAAYTNLAVYAAHRGR